MIELNIFCFILLGTSYHNYLKPAAYNLQHIIYMTVNYAGSCEPLVFFNINKIFYNLKDIQ